MEKLAWWPLKMPSSNKRMTDVDSQYFGDTIHHRTCGVCVCVCVCVCVSMFLSMLLGCIPTEIGRLKLLHTLDLTGNLIHGQYT